MELSKIYLNTLKDLEEKVTNVANIKKLIQNSIKWSLGYEIRNLDEFDDQDFIKLAETAILTLFTISVKHGMNTESLKLFLDQHHIPYSISSELCNTYEIYQTDLYKFIQNNDKFTAPKVTDVAWKLQCDYKSSSSDEQSKKEIIYNINLGNHNPKTGNRETVTEFECNPEELQSFINKLKEIERHCDKLIQK